MSSLEARRQQNVPDRLQRRALPSEAALPERALCPLSSRAHSSRTGKKGKKGNDVERNPRTRGKEPSHRWVLMKMHEPGVPSLEEWVAQHQSALPGPIGIDPALATISAEKAWTDKRRAASS